MIILLFVVHVLIAVALIGVVLLQKSEGGALGMGGGGMSGFMTGRSTSNLLTRTTATWRCCSSPPASFWSGLAMRRPERRRRSSTREGHRRSCR